MYKIIGIKNNKNPKQELIFPEVDFSIRNITHKITIRNEESITSDVRCFSLHCNGTSNLDLFNLIKNYVNHYISKKFESKVFFEGNNNKNKTHSILLFCNDEVDFKSKLLSVNIPNYASEDIRKELKKYLWGLK